MSLTITNAFRWWAREAPERLALDIDGDRVTYGEFFRWVLAAAAELTAEGVGKGDRVGVLSIQSIRYLAVTVGAQFIGAIAVPLNTRFTERELRTALEDTTPKLVFAEDERLDLIRRAAEGTGTEIRELSGVEAWRARTAPLPDHYPQSGDIIAIMSTSGSTAKPKFVKFTHEMVTTIAMELQLAEPDIRQGTSALILSPFFTGGLYVIYEYLVLGCSQYVRTRIDGEELVELLAREKINILPATPIFLERIAATSRFADADLSNLIWATVGGARVPAALVKKWRDKGVLLRSLFGQTEAGGSWVSRGPALENPLEAGYGGPYTEWRIMRDGKFLAPGEIGEIVIRGPSVTPGYWNNDEATEQAIKDGWLHTGDLGSVDATGSLTFVDRIKDIIISGGLNISAAEVEHVIGEMPGVIEVAVIAAPDEKFGETPHAIVYGVEAPSPADIVAHCNANLANYKVPRYVTVQTEPLPRLPSGKLSKPTLRERFKGNEAQLKRVR